MKRLFAPLDPVFIFHSRHQAEVLDILGHYSQTIVECCGTNEDIKATHFPVKVLLYPVQGTADLTIFIKYIVMNCLSHSGSWICLS